MKHRRFFVAAGVLLPTLAVLALLAYGFTREPWYIESPIVGHPAPGLAVTLFDGRAVQLEDFRAHRLRRLGLPEAFIIDAAGPITYKHIGTLRQALLLAKLDEARRAS